MIRHQFNSLIHSVARDPNFGKLVLRCKKNLFLLYILYIHGFNSVMGIKIAMDWGVPHQLIIGWGGVSLTPIFEPPIQGKPNSFLLLPMLFLFYFGLSFYLLSSSSYEMNKDFPLWEVSEKVLVRAIHALMVYTLGHLLLFVVVLANNWGLTPMAFVLGPGDVRVFPIFPPPT